MSLVRAAVGLSQLDAFDRLVERFAPDVLAYWKLADSAGPAALDQEQLVDGAYSGAPTFGSPSIVRQDTGGQCVRLNADGHVDIPHTAELKTAAGTIVVFHQYDSLPDKSILLAADENTTIGGFSLEVMADGGMRSFLVADASGPDYRILEGPPGDVKLRKAYCSVLRWGPGGMTHDLFDETGHVRQLSDPTTAGVSGTSAIRLGAWHTTSSPHLGLIGRVIWLNRRLSDAELAVLALPRTLWEAQAVADSFTVPPGSGIASLAVQANDALLAGDEQTELVAGSFAGDGSIALNADGKRVDYTTPSLEGSASFQYRLKRGWPVSNTVTVTITVSDAGAFTGPTTLQSARTGDNITSVVGIAVESQEPKP